MLKLADRVKEATITQGSGLYIVLNGAAQAFQTFANTIGDGNSTYYTIENNNQFEVGVGTYRLSDNTLCRTTVLSSSNSNQRIVLDGISIVFCTYPASQATFLENGYIKSLYPQYSGIMFPDQTVLTSASGVAGNVSLPSGLVYTSGNQTISGVKTFSDLPFVNGTGVSISGHTHTSSNITDFNSSVSGLLPVTNIVAGTNITVSPVSGTYTINSTASGTQILSYTTAASFPATGSTSSYYLASDSGKIYQWTGSQYAEIGPSLGGLNNAQTAINFYLWSTFR